MGLLLFDAVTFVFNALVMNRGKKQNNQLK